MTVRYEPFELLATLNRHEVRYIVIGGIAGNILGSPTITGDIDICYDRRRENLTHLVAALRELNAKPRLYPPGVPFILDEHTIRNGDTFTFETALGNFDCLATPSGTGGFDDLALRAAPFTIGTSVDVTVCALDDLIRMKTAAGRPKDLIELEYLNALKTTLEEDSL
jgi:hypothetical protein